MAKVAMQVLLDTETIDEIDRIVQDEASTRSAVTRRLIVQALRQ